MYPWLATSAKQTQDPCSWPQGSQQIPGSAIANWQQRNSIFDVTILSGGWLTRFENYRNSWGGGRGVSDKHPFEWNFQGWGDLKQKCPPSGLLIFSGTTQYAHSLLHVTQIVISH